MWTTIHKVLSFSMAIVVLSQHPATTCRAQDQVILEVVINGQNVGQAFLMLTEDGDALVSPDLFSGLRLKKELFADPEADKISLKQFSDALKFNIDYDNAVLTIAIAPQWFESQLVRPPPPKTAPNRNAAVQPHPFSAFLNYRIDAEYNEADDFRAYNLPWEVGFNWNHWFAYSNFKYRYSDEPEDPVRLTTRLIRDDPDRLTRLTLGDFTPPTTGFLGGGVLGGLSWGTRFSLDRTFKPYPGINADLIIETPTRAELYSNGNLVKEWELLPGPVRFEELNTYTGGDAELVLMDAFGKERRIDLPQLFGGRKLLRKGVHEYSYNLGFPRENFGTKSFEYGDFSGIAFHRYGFTDWLTTGIGAAFQNDLYNAGPMLGLRLGADHLIGGEGMISHHNGVTGGAVSTQYMYRKDGFAGGLSFLVYSRNFRPPLSSDDAGDDTIQSLCYRWRLTASRSWPRWGGFSFSYMENNYREEAKNRTSMATLSYSKTLFKNFNFSISVNQGIQGENNRKILFSLQYTPSDDRQKRFFDNISYRHRDAKGEDKQQDISVRKSTGLGKGFGYALGASIKGQETNLSGRTVYRHELGIAEASIQHPSGGDMTGFLAWAGGVGLVDGGLYFGRPIIDSFAVVDVEGLDNVPVYSGSNLVGKTGMRGSLMAPELISYTDNRLSIRPSDLPMDYELTGKDRVVKMGQRGGALVNFKAFRFTAVEGNLYSVVPDGGRKWLSTLPLEYVVGEESKDSFTGQDGYFYLENLPTGEHRLSVYPADGICNAVIIVPETEAIVNNLGDIVCEPAKE